MNRRPPPFVAPACIAALACFVFCGTIHSAATPAMPAIAPNVGCSCGDLLLEGVIAMAIRAEQEAGQDVVGKPMPPLHFERWVNADGGKPLDTAGKVTLYRWWTD